MAAELHPSPYKAQTAAAGAVAGLGMAAVPAVGAMTGLDPTSLAWGLVDAGGRRRDQGTLACCAAVVRGGPNPGCHVDSVAAAVTHLLPICDCCRQLFLLCCLLPPS